MATKTKKPRNIVSIKSKKDYEAERSKALKDKLVPIKNIKESYPKKETLSPIKDRYPKKETLSSIKKKNATTDKSKLVPIKDRYPKKEALSPIKDRKTVKSSGLTTAAARKEQFAIKNTKRKK